MAEAFILAGAVVVAFWIDHQWGEPPARCHFVVWMGGYLGWAGEGLAPAADSVDMSARDIKSLGRGAAAWMAGATVVLGVAWAVQWVCLMLARQGWLATALAALLLGLALKPLLAWRMLRSEVQAVEAALGESLQAGRERTRWLVSRDVTHLTEAQVRESAIESLAENLNDSVVAPVFWFVLLGLPGAALYRFANTADAMWGYHSVRNGRVWEWAGKWAARADDVLSWVPARITAALLVLVAGGMPLAALRREAGRTPSPNSGWPMAAMALALDVCLNKPGVYALNASGRPAKAVDTARAVVYAWKATIVIVLIALLAILLIVKGAPQ